MDPNANLEEQRQLAERMLRDRYHGRSVDRDDAERLAELVLALDEWLKRGGFMPQDWRKL
jgi:hypothetical protein